MNKDVIYPTMVIRSQAETIKLLEEENQKLKDKIKKAIEYIEKQDFIDWHLGANEGHYRRKELLDILKGENNE